MREDIGTGLDQACAVLADVTAMLDVFIGKFLGRSQEQGLLFFYRGAWRGDR